MRHEPVMKKVMRTANALIVSLYRRSSGRIGRTAKGTSVLLLTVPGRKTGTPHTVAVSYFEHNGGYLVTGSGGGMKSEPQWVRNLRVTPKAQIEPRPRPLGSADVPAGDPAACGPARQRQRTAGAPPLRSRLGGPTRTAVAHTRRSHDLPSEPFPHRHTAMVRGAGGVVQWGNHPPGPGAGRGSSPGHSHDPRTGTSQYALAGAGLLAGVPAFLAFPVWLILLANRLRAHLTHAHAQAWAHPHQPMLSRRAR